MYCVCGLKKKQYLVLDTVRVYSVCIRLASVETHLDLDLQTHTMVVTIMMTATETRTAIRIIHLVSVRQQ